MPQNFSELELQVLQDLGMSPNDPAASAMLSRMGEIKDLQMAGDPAFQAGSRFFGGTHGGQVETGLGRFGAAGAGDMSFEDLLAMGFGDGGGGGQGPAWGSTQAGAAAAQQYALELLAKEQGFESQQSKLMREFQAAQDEKQREFQRQQALEELKAERQRMFTDMLGTDPVRAVLFAMGVSGEIMPGGERFEKLPPLKGAGQQARSTEQALESMLGGKVGLGQQGVTGLDPVVKAATAYSAGQGARGSIKDLAAGRTTIGSAYGVGATRGAGRPGMSREEVLRQISSVTPEGALGA